MDGTNAIFAGEFVVGNAADDIGPEAKGFFEEGVILDGVLVGCAVEAVLGKGDNLDGDPVADLVADFEEGLEGGEGGFADVGVGANKEGALLGLEAEGLEGTVFDIGEGEGSFAIAPDLDAFKQRPTLVPAGLSGGEDRVEVNMGFDEGGADELTRGVNFLGGREGKVRADRGNPAVCDGEVRRFRGLGAAGLGETGLIEEAVAENEIRHRESRRVGHAHHNLGENTSDPAPIATPA